MLLRLFVLFVLPLSSHAQYEELAKLFNTTQSKVLNLGGLPDLNCAFVFNNTADNCERLIGGIPDDEPQECGCYNFCGDRLTGCFGYGETPPIFSCPSIYSVVAGCRQNQTDQTSVLSPAGNETKESCPKGYMCTRGRQKLCDEIRQIPLQLGLGDVHAGIYCPGRIDRIDASYVICDLGHYCPNSTTMLPCPKGYFCPHKTMVPEIVCFHCPEGAKVLVRQPYGYIVFGVAAGILFLVVLYEMFKRYNAGLYEQWRELRGRNFDRVRATMLAKQRQERLKKLEPKLKIIERRLGQDSGSYRADPHASVRAISTDNKSGRITFDARKLFRMMDTNKDGILTKEELEHALDLTPKQMREFMRRMNQAARVPADTENISRGVFVKSFLRVLEQTSHFEPTATEASEIFDEIGHSKSTVDVDGIVHEDLFNSSVANFLDDAQINRMIKRFRDLQEKQSLAITRGNADFALEMNNPNGADMDESTGDVHSRPRRNSLLTAVKRASIKRLPMDGEDETNRYGFKRPSIMNFMYKHDVISREEFVAWYPALLMEVTSESQIHDISTASKNRLGGIDVAFDDLSLTVTVKRTDFKIVDGVTGRLQAGSMTALMGGSGAGKTSLLNALCGRAFYGKVTGSIKINGHETTIEEHSSAVGFVPQDDIVYAELTVRENLIFAGRFQLPRGTSSKEIVDLADATMANLGLSRVMHSIVGDVTRRGVSGGEKKRVNIGLELMARTKILFLDEPTSGLDANSALLVMESLKTLAQVNGTTICSVIHQPRKFIFELFDSLILLGVGGKMVYHGRVTGVEAYFTNLHYVLPPGESIADWLIDISSGRLGPSRTLSDQSVQDQSDSQRNKSYLDGITEKSASEEEDDTTNSVDVDKVEDMLANSDRLGSSGRPEGPVLEEPMHADDVSSSPSIMYTSTISFMDLDKPKSLNNADIFEDPAAEAKARREVLYNRWNSYMAQLSEEEREIYEASEPYDLPEKTEKASFSVQFWFQLRRMAIVGQRSWVTKLIDTSIIVGSTVLVSLLDGPEQPTSWTGMGRLNYDFTAEPTSVKEVIQEYPKLFEFAIMGHLVNLQGFGMKAGVLVAVLISLTATKTITSKRKEFFREAASGYSTNAYFLAVQVIATIEHTIQVALCALCAIWLRCALAHWSSWMIAFVLCGWLAVSWALVFPFIFPLENVVLVTGFYMVLFSMLFSGAVAPCTYQTIYGSSGMQIFTGLLSPTRYFLEALALSESKTLPVQAGFTDFGPQIAGEMFDAMVPRNLYLGINDFYVATQRNFDGWNWGALPAFCVGLWVRWISAGLIHVSDRPKQCKKSLLQTVSREPLGFLWLFLYFAIFVGLLVTSCYLILRQTSRYDSQRW